MSSLQDQSEQLPFSIVKCPPAASKIVLPDHTPSPSESSNNNALFPPTNPPPM